MMRIFSGSPFLQNEGGDVSVVEKSQPGLGHCRRRRPDPDLRLLHQQPEDGNQVKPKWCHKNIDPKITSRS